MSDPFRLPPGFNGLPRLEQIRCYQQNGLLVHPCYGPHATECSHPGKQPRWTVLQRLNASAQERLEAFVTDGGVDNVGIVPRSPHITIDVDDHNGDGRGLAAFELMHPKLFGDVLRVRTPEGFHFHFCCEDIPADQEKITIEDYLPGVNVEIFVGDGLNVIYPPSVHPSGVVYVFEGEVELSVSWASLLKAFRYDPKTKSRAREKTNWKEQFRGDLYTLDIVALATKLGIYGQEIREGEDGHVKHSIQCPWTDEHTPGPEWASKDSSTVIFSVENQMPGFKCLHAHCQDRTIRDFLEFAEASEPGLVDKFCSRQWVRPALFQKGSRSEGPRERGTERPDGYYKKIIWTKSTTNQIRWTQKLIYPEDSVLHPYVEYARTQTEGADCFIIGSVLPVVARLMARRVYVQFGAKRIYPNIFSLIVGPPGDRKTHTIEIAERVARALLPNEAFASHLQSSEAFFDEFDINAGGCEDKISIVDDAAGVLATWRTTQYGERVVGMMLRLYDCASLSESFKRNKKETAEKNVRRSIPETSTSLVYGATPFDAVFPRQQHQQGLVRRFLHYVAYSMGRIIHWPDAQQEDQIIEYFRPLLSLKGPVGLSKKARLLWNDFQNDNRAALEQVTEDKPNERHQLSTSPTHVLKIATHFEACRRVATQETFLSEIREDTLSIAIDHVAQCLGAVKSLVGSAKRFETRQQAEAILSQIRHRFSVDSIYPDTIYVGRGKLTRVFCPNPKRMGSLQTDELYNEILPYLIETGEAQLCFKEGKLEVYAFRASDEGPFGPDSGGEGRESGEHFQQNSTGFNASSTISQANCSGVSDSSKETYDVGPDLFSTNSTNSTGACKKHQNKAKNENSIPAIPSNPSPPQKFSLQQEPPMEKFSKPNETAVFGNFSSLLYPPVENVEFVENAPVSPREYEDGSLLNFVEVCGKCVEEAVTDSPLKTEKFLYCASVDSAKGPFEELVAHHSPVISLDLETYGKEPKDGLFPHLGEIRLLTVCLPQANPVIFDLKRIGYDVLPWKELFASRETIVHNGMFEFKWALGKLGVRLPKLFDTMHAVRLLQNGVDGGRQYASLALVLERYLGRTISKLEQRSNFGAEHLSLEQLRYAAGDVAHLADLRTELERLMVTALGGSLLPVFELDMAYLPVLALRELLGIRFNVTLGKALLADARMTIELAQLHLDELWGEKVTLSSPAQVMAAFVRLGFTDIPNTADDTLSGIDHEAARLMRNYRAAQARVKELERVIEYVHPNGRIYPDLDPLGTETARILSTKPTINNLSVDTGARACILADRPGHVVVKCDYSKEEPRIVADVFNVQQLKDDFNAGCNIYKIFAAQIFGVPAEEVNPKQLDAGKTNFLGVVYGEAWRTMVAKALAEGRTLSEQLAKQIISAFDELYPEIREVWRRAKRDAFRGLIRYGKSKLGRRRLLRPLREQPTKVFADRILKPAMVKFFGSVAAAGRAKDLAQCNDPPEGKSESARLKNAVRRAKIHTARETLIKWEKEMLPALQAQITEAWTAFEIRRLNWEAQQLAINYKIQAGGSDVIRKAEILVESRLPANSRILLSNHDEICVSCPKENTQEVVQIVQAAMGEAFNWLYPSVPIESEAEVCETWK